MNKRMKILKEIAVYTDTDHFRKLTKQIGEIAAKAFSNNKAQMKNLENIANSALKASDVLNYIKRQTGRSKPDKQWKNDQFGKKILEKIEGNLKKRRDNICKKQAITADENRLEVYLMLIREFIRQVVIHYEFKAGQ